MWMIIFNLMQPISPIWPAPKNIRALTTTLAEGNLATHTTLDPKDALINRKRMQQTLNLPNEPQWLNQTHSTTCISLPNADLNADACTTTQSHTICTVLTADCLPLLVCNQQGTEISAIHAGWRGLMNGVIEQCINDLQSTPEDLLIWLGPAISVNALELNGDIRQDFLNVNADYHQGFQQKNNAWFADLYQLAQISLKALGITQIYGGDYCTYADSDLFYSYRRQGADSGRIASLIWFV